MIFINLNLLRVRKLVQILIRLTPEIPTLNKKKNLERHHTIEIIIKDLMKKILGISNNTTFVDIKIDNNDD